MLPAIDIIRSRLHSRDQTQNLEMDLSSLPLSFSSFLPPPLIFLLLAASPSSDARHVTDATSASL